MAQGTRRVVRAATLRGVRLTMGAESLLHCLLEQPAAFAELEATYFAKVEELEAREAALEAAVQRGDESEATLSELETVRAHLLWYLEGLDDMGAFNPRD
jgi:hypothetical protein